MKRLINILICFSFVIRVGDLTGQGKKYVSDHLAFGATLVDSSDIPHDLKHKGKVQFALRWNDKKGENYFIACLSDTTNINPGHIKDTVELWGHIECFTYLYRSNYEYNSGPWKVWQDWRKESCRDYINVSFIKKSVFITDIDKDSIAEITFGSRRRCGGESILGNLLLHMVEFDNAYYIEGWALEPESRLKKLTEINVCCGEDSVGWGGMLDSNFFNIVQGMYNSEKELLNSNAPASFIAHMRKTWITVVKNEYEEFYNK